MPTRDLNHCVSSTKNQRDGRLQTNEASRVSVEGLFGSVSRWRTSRERRCGPFVPGLVMTMSRLLRSRRVTAQLGGRIILQIREVGVKDGSPR